MTAHNKRALERANADVVFARIFVAPDPSKALKKLEHIVWVKITELLATNAWVIPALDAREGRFKHPSYYSKDPIEIEEIEKVQNHIRKFKEYAELLASTGETPLTDYLNGISVEDFRCMMVCI